MLYYFKKSENATEMQRKKKQNRFEQCMEKAVTDRMCQNWFAKFHAGDFSLDNTLRSGIPVEVGSNQIETLIENNQHFIIYEIAKLLKISKSMKLLVKMKNVSFILQKKQHHKLFGQPNIYFLINYGMSYFDLKPSGDFEFHSE